MATIRETDVRQMPEFAWIAFTNKCNLKCGHCQRESLKAQGLIKPTEMSEDIFRKVEKELFPHLKRVQFGGNNFGEQLMAACWDDYFARITAFTPRISVVCNCTLLNTKRIRAMVDAGVEFNFSLEGATRQSYERNREFRFDKFIARIKETCWYRERNPTSGAKVNLGFTAFRDNIEEIEMLLSIAKTYGVDRVTITHFVPWQESQRMQSLVYNTELSNKVMEKARLMAGKLNLLVDIPQPFKTGDNAGEKKSIVGPAGQQTECYHPWNSVSINEQGDVMPCCATSVIMGNLKKQGLDEIWRGSKYQKLRDTVNSSRPLSFCRDCALRGIKVGSQEPVAFCSDEEVLLGTIGTQQKKRNLKRRIRTSALGRKAAPLLMHLYRKHIAFIG